MNELLHQNTESSAEALADFKLELQDLKKETGKQSEQQQEPCPFPDHEGYSKVWKKLTPDQQKYMKENIAITSDGKIEVIKMHKKFSLLTATPNDKDILDGSYKDKNGKTGIKGMIYFTGRAAEQECKKQGKGLLSGMEEVDQFIHFFPRIGEASRIEVIGELLGLEMGGYFDAKDGERRGVGSICTIGMSKVNESDDVYEITWGNENAYTFRDPKDHVMTFFVYEDMEVEPKLDGVYEPGTKKQAAKSENTTEKIILKSDTDKSGTFTMPNGKTYPSYEELIKDFPRLKNDSIFKANFPGRERRKERK